MTDLSTKEKILNSAMELMAQKGYEGVSVREIITHADVNLSALNYYFTDKQSLIEIVVNTTIEPLYRQRIALLKKAQADATEATPITIQKILYAFIIPAYMPEIYGGKEGLVSRFIARVLITPQSEQPEIFIEMKNLYIKAVRDLYPQMSENDAFDRLRIASVSAFTLRSFTGHFEEIDPQNFDDPLKHKLKILLDFCEQGFEHAKV